MRLRTQCLFMFYLIHYYDLCSNEGQPKIKRIVSEVFTLFMSWCQLLGTYLDFTIHEVSD